MSVPLTLDLPAPEDTLRLGEDLALALKPGDCVALSGDLGAGKSTLARAFIRAMANDPDLEVPSPTFTLVQSYELRIPVAHFDLYRLADAGELDELGFDEALDGGICLVEWPERAATALPADLIVLTLEHKGDGRVATIRAAEARMDRIRRTLSIRRFLTAHGHGTDSRRHLFGDASMRAYETVTDQDGDDFVLMDWPRRPEGPPVLDGKPYPKVAHIAEDAYPFVAISRYLRDNGFAAPDIFAADYEQGLLLMEDLGRQGILDAQGRPIAERYRESVLALAHLHGCPSPRALPVTKTHTHIIPDFDRTAMTMEVRLLPDWHLPHACGREASAGERAEYLAIWNALIDDLESAERHLLLRDYHSPNIIWRDGLSGLARIGIIDFQDAMIGPTSYDLASIVQDARVTIDRELATDLMDSYVAARHAQGNFDETSFRRSFAIMAAQRACKLAGLWLRLKHRDGKPGYVRHMPRTLAYLADALAHEALSPLRDWCVKAGMQFPESRSPGR